MSKFAIIILVALALVAAVAVLVLVLSPKKVNRSAVVYENPTNILFSVPTICDLAPSVEPPPTPPTSNDFVQDEDYWRQIEFVPLRDISNLTNLVAEVKDFEKLNRENYGWKNTFIRKEYPIRIKDLNLSFQKLIDSFSPRPEPHKLFLVSGTSKAQVKGGFCLNVKDLGTIYGQQNDDKIFELGFEPERARPISQSSLAELTAFCQQNQLIMVDWYRREIVDLKDPRFKPLAAKGSPTSP